ncbi:MAG: ABC transporter ATP-binding protein [Candidatus Heimdallarchaeota archaeon]|nr:ABC transporter ATP-binding protein [Candidatus Heimdallarchaeota archaeon]
MSAFSKYYSLLKEYLKPYKVQIIILATLMFTRIGISLYYPQIVANYIDSITYKSIDELQQLAIVYIVFAVLEQFIYVGSVFFAQNVSWGSTNKLRQDLLEHGVKLDMSFHNQYKPGQMIERIDGDVNALSNFFSQMVIALIANILLIFTIVLLMFLEDITIGFAFLIFIIISTFIIGKVRNIAVKHFREHREKAMLLFGFIEERLSGIEDIKAIGAIPGVKKDYYYLEKDKYRTMIKAVLISRTLNLAFNMLMGTAIAMGLAMGTPMYLSGEMSLGTLFVIYYYTTMLVRPIMMILRQIQNLQEADASIERIEELKSYSSKIEDNGVADITDDNITISFDHVSFSYHDDKPILKDLSFNINKGETLGLIGRTGSGKTTITRLLYRLYDLDGGDILINNQPIRSLKLSSLRKNIGMVTQEVQLFQTSLRNNVTFFDKSIPDERIIAVIKDVGLEEWYNTLEKGLDTIISSDQTGVSAGEAQLLSVTRLFLSNPKMVILDEASSRLDPITEKKLDRAVSKLTEDKTTIIIAHRLSTLEEVDKILLIDDGQLIEFDNRIKLRDDKNSRYYHLLQTGIEEVLV